MIRMAQRQVAALFWVYTKLIPDKTAHLRRKTLNLTAASTNITFSVFSFS